MDVMEMRFRMMAMIGGSSMVGELSRYVKFAVTPSDSTKLETNNPLGVIPKIVIVTAPENSEARTTNGWIYDFISNNAVGCGDSINLASGNRSLWGFSVVTGTAGNSNFIYTENVLHIHRGSANGAWNTNTEYTIELYA